MTMIEESTFVIVDKEMSPEIKNRATKEPLEERVKATMKKMNDGQSFWMAVEETDVRRKINAMRSHVRRQEESNPSGSKYSFVRQNISNEDGSITYGIEIYKYSPEKDQIEDQQQI
tara:strand:- start:5537 stop:5884 length:348 start_codon:yes stop_codon:yes gene_type:complete